MENIKKLVYACDNDVPVKITFPDGNVGPNERVVRMSAEDFTIAVSPELAKIDEIEPGDTIDCPWEFVESVELLST
mgnify:CR=1 FL=1